MSEDEQRRHPELAEEQDLTQLWRRINDHKMVQWSVAYVALAYGFQHALTLTSEAFEWPHAVTRVSMMLLVLGLPFVMTLAWYHGARASRRVSGAELTIISLLLVVISALFYIFVRPSEQSANTAAAVIPKSLPASNLATPSGISVAVLPFLNLSGNPKEEYFSDGMTEEITSALANVKGLNVVARTSAFSFKGKNEDVRTIGRALSATDVIEGSVRKEGNEVRITAQLIRTDTGDHLWTESYDRELKDVFAVQEDIARAIAAALQVPLGLKAGEDLVANRTSDTAAYEDYLRALALYRARDIKKVIDLLEPIVKRNQTYAPAWALLALAYEQEPRYVIPGEALPINERIAAVISAFKDADKAAHEAVRLDSHNTLGYTALGLLDTFRGQWAPADDEFKKAVALDPTDPDVLNLYSQFLVNVGRSSKALRMRLALLRLEPFIPIYNEDTAEVMQISGDIKGAIAIHEQLPSDGTIGAFRDSFLALAYASLGQYQRAAKTLLIIPPDQIIIPVSVARQAAGIIRKAPENVAAPEPTPASKVFLGWVYAFVGAPERAVDLPERDQALGYYGGPSVWVLWHPALTAVRKTERFKALVRKLGLVDYWRAKGWPDLCHPVGQNDFACN